jgi:hypothetical protein
LIEYIQFSYSITNYNNIILTALSGTHRGVPIFKIPALTVTPIMIGYLLLKTAPLTTSKIQGKTALDPSSVFLSSLHYFTYLTNASNRLYMISAVNILMPFSSANSAASGVTFTSNAKKEAYSV